MYSPSSRPSPSGPPTWLQIFETAPNFPSLRDIASSRFPALMGLSGGPEGSSAEPMSTQFSSPAMTIPCSQLFYYNRCAWPIVSSKYWSNRLRWRLSKNLPARDHRQSRLGMIAEKQDGKECGGHGWIGVA